MPGVLALVDVPLQHRVKALEPLGRESLGFRRASGQRLRGSGGGCQDEGDDKGEQRPNQHCARFYQATHPAGGNRVQPGPTRFNVINLVNLIDLINL